MDGTKYPTSTPIMLLSGLKRYMTSSNPNFLDEKDFLIIAGICTMYSLTFVKFNLQLSDE